VLVEPRLDKSAEPYAWYLFADPAVAPTFEVSELSGYEGPRVESRTGFNVLGNGNGALSGIWAPVASIRDAASKIPVPLPA
jgi:hypothetical protein